MEFKYNLYHCEQSFMSRLCITLFKIRYAMKKRILRISILAVFVTMMVSCATTTFQRQKVVIIDYSKYASDNFYITESNCVDFKYEPLGSVVVRSAQNTLNVEHVFNDFIEKCRTSGADGLINLKINMYSDKEGDAGGGDYVIQGMAIKKK